MPSPSAAARPPTTFPSLDGLRAVAVLWVILHTLMPLQDPQGAASYLLVALADRGWFGVQLFLALSGFLITGILMDTARSSNHYGAFFMRRVLRIFPVYYLVLAVTLGLLPALGWTTPEFHHRHPELDVWYWLYLSNWFNPAHKGEVPLPHFWSLAVEEQFYLLWPFLIHRLSAGRVLALSLLLAAAAPVARWLLLAHGQSEEAVYQFSVSRMDALTLGAACAAALRLGAHEGAGMGPHAAALLRRWPLWLGLALAGFVLQEALVRLSPRFGLPQQVLSYSALSVACALVVLACVGADVLTVQGGFAPLRSRVLRKIGRHSYAMYVLHMPLHALVGLPLLRRLGVPHPGVAGALAYVLAGMLVTYAMSVALYHLFEVHFLRLKDRWAPRPAAGPGQAPVPT